LLHTAKPRRWSSKLSNLSGKKRWKWGPVKKASEERNGGKVRKDSTEINTDEAGECWLERHRLRRVLRWSVIRSVQRTKRKSENPSTKN